MKHRHDVASVTSSVVMLYPKIHNFINITLLSHQQLLWPLLSQSIAVRKIKHCSGNVTYLYNNVSQNGQTVLSNGQQTMWSYELVFYICFNSNINENIPHLLCIVVITKLVSCKMEVIIIILPIQIERITHI